MDTMDDEGMGGEYSRHFNPIMFELLRVANANPDSSPKIYAMLRELWDQIDKKLTQSSARLYFSDVEPLLRTVESKLGW